MGGSYRRLTFLTFTSRMRTLSGSFDWATSIDRCDRPCALFYLDPPYFETEGYGVAFPFAEYEKIAERLRSIKGAGDRQPQ